MLVVMVCGPYWLLKYIWSSAGKVKFQQQSLVNLPSAFIGLCHLHKNVKTIKL